MPLSPAGLPRRLFPAALAACALALLPVAGCTPRDAGPPPPGSSATAAGPTGGAAVPSAGSSASQTLPTELDLDAEEQKAAREALHAFDEYLRVSDEVLRDGGKHPERLERVAAGIVLEGEINGAKQFADEQTRALGKSRYDDLSVESVSLKNSPPDDRPTVALRMCVDVSQTDVVDRKGKSVLTTDRPEHFLNTYYVWFDDSAHSWLVGDLKQGERSC